MNLVQPFSFATNVSIGQLAAGRLSKFCGPPLPLRVRTPVNVHARFARILPAGVSDVELSFAHVCRLESTALKDADNSVRL